MSPHRWSSQVENRQQFTGIIRDISGRKALEEQLLSVAEQEQRRIGQDLHDDVGQELTGLRLTAEALVEALQESASPEAGLAARISEGVQRTLRKVRMLSRGLVPVEVDAEGLMSALTELASRSTQLHQVECRFNCDEPCLVEDNRTATQLYRIAQEAMGNALRHAQARQIRISLTTASGVIQLRVTDDGVGMPEPPVNSGMGLRIMRSRAESIGGTFDIQPGPGGGTEVSCIVQNNYDE